jgi:hypothetical protein
MGRDAAETGRGSKSLLLAPRFSSRAFKITLDAAIASEYKMRAQTGEYYRKQIFD